MTKEQALMAFIEWYKTKDEICDFDCIVFDENNGSCKELEYFIGLDINGVRNACLTEKAKEEFITYLKQND